MEVLNEALAFEKGTAKAETLSRKRSLPEVNITGVHMDLGMTQKKFSEVLGVSPSTVEAWECGKSTPTPTAKKLIFLIKEDNSLVDKLLHN